MFTLARVFLMAGTVRAEFFEDEYEYEDEDELLGGTSRVTCLAEEEAEEEEEESLPFSHMPNSPIDICNLALAHLGEAPITSLAEDSLAGRACQLHYGQTRDAVLRAHRWNFATTRVALEQVLPAPAFRYSYRYQLPGNCLRVLEVNDTEIGDWLDERFVIEGRQILTNEATVNLIYIQRIENVTKFDALFVEALAVKLAIVLSETIRGTTSKTAELEQNYERITAPTARRIDANEGKRRKGMLPMNSLAIRARFTGV
jgi:hypothetical protein